MGCGDLMGCGRIMGFDDLMGCDDLLGCSDLMGSNDPMVCGYPMGCGGRLGGDDLTGCWAAMIRPHGWRRYHWLMGRDDLTPMGCGARMGFGDCMVCSDPGGVCRSHGAFPSPAAASLPRSAALQHRTHACSDRGAAAPGSSTEGPHAPGGHTGLRDIAPDSRPVASDRGACPPTAPSAGAGGDSGRAGGARGPTQPASSVARMPRFEGRRTTAQDVWRAAARDGSCVARAPLARSSRGYLAQNGAKPQPQQDGVA